MRKSFFILALMATSFLGANNSTKNTEVVEGVCSNWATITAPCGSVYYLCTDSYANYQEMQADINYFNAVKCDTGGIE